jgi:hypothetical protein
MKVWHIAGMLAFRSHHSMLLVVRIEVPACGCEGCLTFPDSMHVESVFAGRQTFDGEFQKYASGRLD